ncbi:MAG: lipopolysaccharide biosynthesis protein [Gammaproteobacteria bacterium]|nr:lipopolysaccharide biosynthesis protein [Gammaproteobacteria bacterium]
MSHGLQSAVMRGALWTVAFRFATRGIGLISTLVLARLLVPADFGVVAMATVVLGFTDLLLNFGVGTALIQNTEADETDYHNAWTLQVLQGLAVGGVLVGIAPWVGEYYRDARVVDVLRMLALAQFLGSLENIGMVAFQKALNFRTDFILFVMRKLLAFTVTVTLAVTLQSYWALVFGSLTGQLASTVLSYVLHPFRPRLRFDRLKKLLSFSQWLLLRNLGTYALVRSDSIMLGNRADAATLGAYNLAIEFSELPSTELVVPINRALLPGFSKIQEDMERLRGSLARVFALLTAVVLPLGMGMSLVAEPFVRVVLGEKWLASVPFLETLCIAGVAMAYRLTGVTVLTAIGRVRLAALAIWAHVLTYYLAVLLLFPQMGAEGFAWLRVVLAVGMGLTMLVELRLVGLLDAGRMLSECWRPAVAAFSMWPLLRWLEPRLELPVLAQLLLLGAAGSLVYVTALLGLWWVSGRPDGAEAFLLKRVKLRQA